MANHEPAGRFYYHDQYPFSLDDHDQFGNTTTSSSTATGFPFKSSCSKPSSMSIANSLSDHDGLQVFDPPPYMSFTDRYCLPESMDYYRLGRGFGSSSPPISSEAIFYGVDEDEKKVPVVDAGDHIMGRTRTGDPCSTPVTPNSSVTSSSSEAGGDAKDSNKRKKDSDQQDGGESSKKVQVVELWSKTKKKGEKKEKEARFAFMTKSEVDHLEDGYRWRKYGQKAVKNSSFPRSYYRCTTPSCTVKKHVERSFQDPTIVLTTYEGQHKHPIPATLRGNVAGGVFPVPFAGTSIDKLSPKVCVSKSWCQIELPIPLSSVSEPRGCATGTSTSSNAPAVLLDEQQRLQLLDCGLLQDMVPSVFVKQEP